MSVGELIRTYQSIFGAALGAAVTAVIFVVGRITRRGRINFLYNNISGKLWIREATSPVRTNNLERATDGEVTFCYDLYNKSGSRKVMRQFSFALKAGRNMTYLQGQADNAIVRLGNYSVATVGERFPKILVDPPQVSVITLDPEEPVTIRVRISMSKMTLDAVKKYDALFVFLYKDENNRNRKFVFTRIKDNKKVLYEM